MYYIEVDHQPIESKRRDVHGRGWAYARKMGREITTATVRHRCLCRCNELNSGPIYLSFRVSKDTPVTPISLRGTLLLLLGSMRHWAMHSGF